MDQIDSSIQSIPELKNSLIYQQKFKINKHIGKGGFGVVFDGVELETNKEIASKIGINPAARTTCVKPEGCHDITAKVKTSEGIKTFVEISCTSETNIVRNFSHGALFC